MNIKYKNGIGCRNGKYYGKIKVHGVQRQFLCHGAKNESQARAIIDAEKYKLRQELAGLIQPKKKKQVITVDYMFQKLFKYGENSNKKTVSKDKYHAKVITQYFKAHNLNDVCLIKQKHIKNLQVYLKTTPMEDGKYRLPATVNRYIASLKTAFNLLINDEDINITQNPCKGVKALTEDNLRTTYLPEHLHDEFLALLPAIVSDMVRLDLQTGLRIGNIFKAHKDQFDLNSGYWSIKKEENKGKKDIKIKLNKIALRIITKYYNNTDYYLFLNPETQRPFTSIKKSFATAANKIGIPELLPKDIRRTVGTILYQKGVSLRVIRDIYAHSSVATTERYLGITAGEVDNAYELLESI